MTTTPRPATPKSGPRRVLMLVVGVLIMVAPGVITSTLWTPEATSPLLLGSIVGAVAAAALGWRLGLLTVFIMGLATPAAIVAGGVPLAGAGLMALLCLFTGLTASWGMHNVFRMVPLVLAYPMIQPPSLGTLGADRASEPYVLAMMLLMTGGGLWMVLVLAVVSRHRTLPELQPADRHDALSYTVAITVLVTVNTFAVLTLNPSSEGAWLILTLIAVTQLGPLQSMSRTVYRVIGTVIGTAIAAAIGAATSSVALQQVLALVLIVIAIYFRTSSYWVYVTFLTPAVVMLSAGGEVVEAGEWRVIYTVIGATQVLLASALVIGYQHLRSSGRAQPGDLQPEPMTEPATTSAAE